MLALRTYRCSDLPEQRVREVWRAAAARILCRHFSALPLFVRTVIAWWDLTGKGVQCSDCEQDATEGHAEKPPTCCDKARCPKCANKHWIEHFERVKT